MLSRAHAARLIEGLKQRSPDSGLLERHLAIEEALAGNPISVGNKVTLLEDGPATYKAMLTAIAGAKHHVHMEMYIFEDDDTGKLFATALKERAAAGVKVRLLYDGVGSIETAKAFFKDLVDNGVEVAEFNPVNVSNMLLDGLHIQNRDHRKLTLVDGRIAFLGGINISGVYGTFGSAVKSRRTSDSAAPGASGGPSASGGSRMSGGPDKDADKGKPKDYDPANPPFEKRPWRDLQVRLEGPIVADLQRSFVGQWDRWSKAKLDGQQGYFPQLRSEGNLFARAIEGSPRLKGANSAYVALISAIENADTSVTIMNAYFVPHPLLRAALCDAALRGVDVKLILPGKSDNALVYHAGRAYYDELLEAGVKIYERESRFLHAKSATVDGVWSTVGSTNLDWRSLAYNDELNAVVLGPEFASQVSDVLAKDITNSREVTLDAWRRRPIEDRVKELAARAWAHFL